MKISMDYKKENYGISISNPSVSAGIYITDDNNVAILSTRMERSQFFIQGLSNPSNPYTTTAYPYPNNEWYRLIFEISKIAENKYSITSTVFRLGIDGQDTPIKIAKNIVSGYNYKFKNSNIVNIHFAGGWWGDVKYLDNFSIYGFKNGSNCNNLSTNDISNNDKELNVFPNPTSKYLYFSKAIDKVEILNIIGQNIQTFFKPNDKIDISNLTIGDYVIKIHIGDKVIIKKIIKK